jgi:hypothetical protein
MEYGVLTPRYLLAHVDGGGVLWCSVFDGASAIFVRGWAVPWIWTLLKGARLGILSVMELKPKQTLEDRSIELQPSEGQNWSQCQARPATVQTPFQPLVTIKFSLAHHNWHISSFAN